MCDEKEASHWAGRGCGPWMGPRPWMHGPWMRHGMHYGPWMRHGMRGHWGRDRCPCCGREIQPPTKAERIEGLEAVKKRLEKRLSNINKKIEELKNEE